MDILSTRQVAELLSVSEATVKRWADDGALRCFRTPGGHRRFRTHEVSEFARSMTAGESNRSDTQPSFGRSADAPSQPSELSPSDVFRLAALSGDPEGLLALVAQQRLRGMGLATIFDTVAAPALTEIGRQWATGELTVAQEHIASSAVVEMLARLRPLLDAPHPRNRVVLLACPGDEQHDIALRMASLLALSVGFRPVMVGSRTPASDLALVVLAERPRFLVLSASPSATEESLRRDLDRLCSACASSGSRLIVGGRGFASLGGLPAPARAVPDLRTLRDLLESDTSAS